ncbi:hypothetical protein ES708_12122 [subsurface metagenome]
MDDKVLKQAEEILEKKAWDDFWRQYQESVERADWGRAHNLLVEMLLPKLFANHNKMVEIVKARDELISKYKELAERSAETIKRIASLIGGEK